METTTTELETFLVEPLTDHEHGLAAGVEAALTAITERVETWSQEVTV